MTQPIRSSVPAVARVELYDSWGALLAVAEATNNGMWRIRCGGRLVVADTRIGAVLTAVSMAEEGGA